MPAHRYPPAVDAPRIALAVAVGVLVGVITSLEQSHLPGALDAFTNSASAWLVFAFLVGCMMPSPLTAAAGGAATCMAELVGYYVTASARGLGIGGGSMLALWIACAVFGGPILALAGFWWRNGPAPVRSLAPLALAACFAVEGLRYSSVLHESGRASLWLGIALGITCLAVGVHVLRTRKQPVS